MKCVACDHELETSAKFCHICGSLQAARLCGLCKRRIPWNANICNGCKSIQRGSWLFFVVTIVAPISTVVTMIYGIVNISSAVSRQSRTHMRFLAADTDASTIKATVWNSGQDASWILAVRLVFEDRRVAPLPLTLELSEDGKCGTNLVKGGEAVTLCLDTGPFRFRRSDDWGGVYQRAQGLTLVQKHKVTLEIDVQESNDPGLFGLRTHQPRKETFDEISVDPFLKGFLWPH